MERTICAEFAIFLATNSLQQLAHYAKQGYKPRGVSTVVAQEFLLSQQPLKRNEQQQPEDQESCSRNDVFSEVFKAL